MLRQELLLLMYNKDVICVIDKGQDPICKSMPRPNRRSGSGINNHVPSHDPYIPRAHSVFYDCSDIECKSVILHSLTQLASLKSTLKSCFNESNNFKCETIRYNYLKNIDKLLFLTSNIRNKTFYMVDCLVYSDGGRVCHKKDDVDSYTKLVDTGTIARPNEPSILSQDEFICEEGQDNSVNCDLNPYVPYENGLKLKETIKPDVNVLLKTGTHMVILKRSCVNSWCGYSGIVGPTRRNPYSYEPPGGKVFRCYYAKKQQVCACSTLAALDGYSPQQDPNQFHIQTDEDDERYFLYQTHNGQYRKERRLKDGSVVGSTGWVGADGYLRLQDYIADNQGYRIYRSKTVYVGQNRPISESLNIAKTAPTDPGYGVTPAPAVQRTSAPPRVTSTTSNPVQPTTTHEPPNNLPSDVSVTSPPPYYPHPTSSPYVHVTPNSVDSSTAYDFKPTETPVSSNEATTTANPYYYDSSNTNTLDDYYASDSKRIDVFNPNSYRHADDWIRRQRPNVPLGDGYTPQFPAYDGIAFKKNGFRYYLPKQYHEEQSEGSDDRTGSFGYIDPFGIRRVIYYNIAPGEGFQIRKNNRYVGHDATPYDPRPVN